MINCDDLIGTPFETLNCWDLTREIYARHGILLEGYDVAVDACEEISKIYERELEQTPTTRWKRIYILEDLCLLPIRRHPKFVSHCGVYIGMGMFIHSLADVGVVTGRVSDPMWKRKITGFYRYVG